MDIKVKIGMVEVEINDGNSQELNEVLKTVCDYFYTLEKFADKLSEGLPDFNLFTSKVNYSDVVDPLLDTGNPLPLEGSIPVTGDIHKTGGEDES
tara:strand:- start:1015 stop:1299 length:285 start_codon:yes stop_codon:yes gene_type:complete